MCGLFDKVHISDGQVHRRKTRNRLRSGSELLEQNITISMGQRLRGLMSEHQIDPNEYLDYVHQINYEVVSPNEGSC